MKIDRLIERMLFASRWLLAPVYLGLGILLAIFAVRFFIGSANWPGTCRRAANPISWSALSG